MEISNQEEEEKAAPIVFLDRASRQTRGKRMTKLLDEENEEDDLFWNQDALLEEENDNNYDEEPEIADEFDSDFDDNESEPDEEAQNVPDERKQKRKRLVYPGKPSTKKKKKKKVLSNLGEESKDEKLAEDSTAPEHHDAGDDGEGERIVRKSTRTSVIVRQAERDAISAALQATMKPIKRKKVGEEKRMTQEEMLLEAAQTEIMNLRNLERVLAREEEVKKRAIVHKAVYNGPQIRYFSKDGCSYLEFRGISFQSEISVASNPYPEKPVCAITGLPAKYRDPKTGLPYATKEAFKIIRARYEDENNIKKEMDMGVLSDSLNGKGFSGRRKRIPNSNRRKLPNFSYMSQFGKAPTIEIDSSE
ncbi:SWR1 complex subunit 2 isoform X2 [Mercurialis annua]|uniref:SWR1 complex subunit 2 isoform X2 n=1 Tax=Mercurialis annua TaxID=3986 RepID=UPI00215F66F8|nr:SWR1 complex subunit 2 isoform X2 [Mercurialis annua]